MLGGNKNPDDFYNKLDATKLEPKRIQLVQILGD